MKYNELQVQYRQKDIHVQHLKKQLDEAEDKISSLKKVHYNYVYDNMYIVSTL